MNGSLSVQSEGPGKGATFTLELPPAPVVETTRKLKCNGRSNQMKQPD